MSNHKKTWFLWLEKISVNHVKPENLEAMAEALSLASPQGPTGFPCLDGDCEVHKWDFNAKRKPQNRWNLRVVEDNNRARLIFSDGPDIIGAMVMSWEDYGALCRIISNFLLRIAKESNEKFLHERLFKDAIVRFDNSPELAQIKLLEFGWTVEMLNCYADDMAKQLVKKVIDHLPEHG